MNAKILLTSGDSFSNTLYDQHGAVRNRTWPIWLRDKLPGVQHFSEGIGGQSNQLIAHRLHYRLHMILKDHAAQDILVGVMWSGRDRWSVFDSTLHSVETDRDKDGRPVNFIPDAQGHWILCHPNHNHDLNHVYYKHFYDPVWAQIMTIQEIVTTQQYLKYLQVPYFMTQSFDACFDHALTADPNVSWLYQQIDFASWLPVTSMQDWCNEHCPTGDNNFHPRTEQCQQFVDQVVWPFVQNLI